MEYNLHNNEQESVIIREKTSTSKNLLYWILGLLLLILFGWYGYTAGWFSSRSHDDILSVEESSIGAEGEGDILTSDLLNPAPIDSLRIETLESFPIQQTLVVSGTLPDGCTYLNTPTQIRDGNIFYITLDTRTEGEICTQALVPFEERINLQVNNLPAGVYIVDINGREISFELEGDNVLDFSAGSDK